MIPREMDSPSKPATRAELEAVWRYLRETRQVRQLVTLLQVAEAIQKSKVTLSRYALESSFPKPLNPDRRNGQVAYYDWLEIREFLKKRTGIEYPFEFASVYLS